VEPQKVEHCQLTECAGVLVAGMQHQGVYPFTSCGRLCRVDGGGEAGKAAKACVCLLAIALCAKVGVCRLEARVCSMV